MAINTFTRKIALAAVLAAPVWITGCAVRAGYYDANHRDYHRWNSAEEPYYRNWENENHRNHRDYDRLDRDDRGAYWNWRHEHP